MCNFKTICFLFVILLFLFTGCASTAIYVNGAPAGTYLKIGNILNSNVEYYFSAGAKILVKEGKETGVLDFPIDASKEVSIYPNTKDLYVNIRIFNPDKNKYSLVETYRMIGENGDFDVSISKEIYSGRFSRKDFVRSIPITNTDVGQYAVLLKDEKGRILAVVGEVTYRHKEEEDARLGLSTH